MGGFLFFTIVSVCLARLSDVAACSACLLVCGLGSTLRVSVLCVTLSVTAWSGFEVLRGFAALSFRNKMISVFLKGGMIMQNICCEVLFSSFSFYFGLMLCCAASPCFPLYHLSLTALFSCGPASLLRLCCLQRTVRFNVGLHFLFAVVWFLCRTFWAISRCL